MFRADGSGYGTRRLGQSKWRMTMDTYILDGHTPIPCSIEQWGKWMFITDSYVSSVGLTTTRDAKISTVFLGMDHQMFDGPPLLFETMVFGGEHDEFQERCSTWDEAEAMHARAVAMVSTGE
jgi:hypothetical protein